MFRVILLQNGYNRLQFRIHIAFYIEMVYTIYSEERGQRKPGQGSPSYILRKY